MIWWCACLKPNHNYEFWSVFRDRWSEIGLRTKIPVVLNTRVEKDQHTWDRSWYDHGSGLERLSWVSTRSREVFRQYACLGSVHRLFKEWSPRWQHKTVVCFKIGKQGYCSRKRGLNIKTRKKPKESDAIIEAAQTGRAGGIYGQYRHPRQVL